MKALKLKIGDRIKFRGMKRPFPVVAHNRFFTICAYRLTGALADKEFVYTVIDWANERRGPDSMIFGPTYNYTKPEEAKQALKELGNGRMKRVNHRGRYVWTDQKLETSRRRSMELDIERVIARSAFEE